METFLTIVTLGFVLAMVVLFVWVFLVAPFVVPRRAARR
jgi:hypothetical protein